MGLRQQDSVLESGTVWYGDDIDSAATDIAYDVSQYSLVSSPNDFNTKTMVDFIESNVFSIPQFQRNYVWDIKHASRLIESIITGLPIPQVFLYEKNRNDFLVIDGQQRLLSIYYFAKGRFPKKNSRVWHTMTGTHSNRVETLPLHDDGYFTDFKLDLPNVMSGKQNRLHGYGYEDLTDNDRNTFDLRTIRNIIIRQMHPDGYDSMYEVFNRLNSGGMTLATQEIRHCMYASIFYTMLYRANTKENWRRLIRRTEPDIRMKDIEILLRGFAMLINGKSYRRPLIKFLNDFSNKATSYDDVQVNTLEKLFDSFLDKNKDLPDDAFLISGRFSPIIFEAVFVASCTGRIEQTDARIIESAQLEKLKNNHEFRSAAQSNTTGAENVTTRLNLACSMLVNDDD